MAPKARLGLIAHVYHININYVRAIGSVSGCGSCSESSTKRNLGVMLRLFGLYVYLRIRIQMLYGVRDAMFGFLDRASAPCILRLSNAFSGAYPSPGRRLASSTPTCLLFTYLPPNALRSFFQARITGRLHPYLTLPSLST
jgi:hypothetical protein